ncbi:glycosyltransferase family 2 protein [Rhodobacteraceae bacterium KN286]|uniref:Glycosyltransferase family 2 protein n=2 Tax=Oceanomicrobium pacificus TaxID=2692916 RepID=A0A6B0U277_9RHOB|nr:glycosyltransferase family 2 protein [Oceanomicrobium pacificus]
MTKTSTEPSSDSLPQWFLDLHPRSQGEGFFEKQERYSLVFVKRPVNRLLITFDNLSNVGDTALDRAPWAYKFASDENVAHLGVMAHIADWFRNPELIARFEALAADGFFDGYDRVLLAGSSMGAYAALAFGSLIPGAHVAAFNPQSTLDEELVPWEERYLNGRRQDWTLPLSDAAEGIGALGHAAIFYDPFFEPDRRHFERLEGPNVTGYKCWFSNHKSAVFLRKIDALKPVMHAMLHGDLTERDFYGLYRARRRLPWYRGGLSKYFNDRDRKEMANRATRAFRALKRAEPSAVAPTAVSDTALPALALREGADPNVRTIVTTMKNEGPFMLEWIAFNRMIGFTDFIIFTNDCADGTDLIADRLQEMGLVHHVRNEVPKHLGPQRVALRRVPQHPQYQRSGWLTCMDCDEFLNIRTGDGTLDALFAAVPDADIFSFCWKLFGNDGIVAYEDRPITSQFTACAGELEFKTYKSTGLKTLARNTTALERLRVHRPALTPTAPMPKWVDAGGQPMPEGYFTRGWSAYSGFRHDLARLHHYAVRSVESFLVKRDRGRTNHFDQDQGLDYWTDMNINTERDTALRERSPEIEHAIGPLMEDRALRDFHAKACDWHRSRIAGLVDDADWSAFAERIAEVA